MSNIVNLLSKLNIKENSGIIFNNSGIFPENPDIGQLAFVNKILSIYSDVNGSGAWFPLLNADVPTYTHTQGLESLTWTVTHGLESDDLIYFVYDNNNNVVYPSSIEFSSNNQFVITFTESIKGKCIVFSGDLKITGNDISNIEGLQDILDNKLDSNANAVSASKLNTAINIGGVSFDGTNNIDLPGVNIAGNQDTTGNADTATTSTNCSRSITGGTGLTGGGVLNTNHTLSINFGTTVGTVCQGNDNRLSDARTPVAHTHDISNINNLQSNLDSKLNFNFELYFDSLSISSIVYIDSNISEIIYSTGNKKVFNYTDNLINTIEYYDENATTLLATQTLTHNDQNLISSVSWI